MHLKYMQFHSLIHTLW